MGIVKTRDGLYSFGISRGKSSFNAAMAGFLQVIELDDEIPLLRRHCPFFFVENAHFIGRLLSISIAQSIEVAQC